jgi:RNase adaptor protein for sRNA GlmZ degradation
MPRGSIATGTTDNGDSLAAEITGDRELFTVDNRAVDLLSELLTAMKDMTEQLTLLNSRFNN